MPRSTNWAKLVFDLVDSDIKAFDGEDLSDSPESNRIRIYFGPKEDVRCYDIERCQEFVNGRPAEQSYLVWDITDPDDRSFADAKNLFFSLKQKKTEKLP